MQLNNPQGGCTKHRQVEGETLSRASAGLDVQLPGESNQADKGCACGVSSQLLTSHGKYQSYVGFVNLREFQGFPPFCRGDAKITGRFLTEVLCRSCEELMARQGQSPEASGSDQSKLTPLWVRDHVLQCQEVNPATFQSVVFQTGEHFEQITALSWPY